MAEQQRPDWFADRERQRRTQQAADRFTLEWNRGPVRRRFDDILAPLPGQSAEAVAEAVRTLFADDGWIGTLIDGLAAELAADPFFEPPLRHLHTDIHDGLLVYEDERVAIAAGVTSLVRLAAKKQARRGATSINFSGQIDIFKFVRAGGARLSLWEAPTITPGFTAAGAGRGARAGERRLADGEIVTIDGRHQAFVIEEARANLVILQASITLDRAPLSVEYDSASLGYVASSATGDSASRIQMITTLIRKLGCDGGFEAVAGFLDHQDFFVRWHVMKELLGMDAAAALPRLKRMAARDPHVEVRRAARAVLERIDAPAKAA